MHRRAFLASTGVVSALLRLLKAPPVWADDSGRQPPYLKLAPYISPGHDEFPEEQEAMKIEAALAQAVSSRELPLDASFQGASPVAARWKDAGGGVSEAAFDEQPADTGAGFLQWLSSFGEITRAQFFALPDDVIRYEIAGRQPDRLAYCVGHWKARWKEGRLTHLAPLDETRAVSAETLFRDVTGSVFESCPTFQDQLSRGVPYWRARLDPATGIDIYGSNGIAAGDIDNDGVDEIFICQPGGLPNRLFKFRDGRFEDITAAWGVDLLDDTSAALFLDLRNSGRQDLVVLRSAGPLLYVNEGARFRLRDDAFRFATAPKGGFTGMAAADYDRDGKLDLYLCTYVFFQSEAQYTYPVPYHDAQNGPPNFLFRNRLDAHGAGFFTDVTEESGMNHNNNRFSFAASWCDDNGDGWPDLYVANDFGRNNLYRSENGRFRDVASEAGVEDLGPGMSASWFDYDGDGRPDLYVGNMWSAPGQRVVRSPRFAPGQPRGLAEAYRRHAKGNSLYRNRGDGTYEETTEREGGGMGRWAWSSGGHDLDNDGSPEILGTCGMLTNTSRDDVMSFFWRQVVSRSPAKAEPSAAYENGWNAINQFIRENYSWNGREPNVFYARRGNRYYDLSGISGFDFADDSRAFTVADFDGDGRPDIVLKSRLGPQVRVLQNNCAGSSQERPAQRSLGRGSSPTRPFDTSGAATGPVRANSSIAFELRGTKSNRDAIGAKIEVNGRAVWLDAGNGYLSQHSKRVIAGLGAVPRAEKIRITWPSGLVQELPTLDAGRIYRVTEGSAEITSRAFSPHRPLRAGSLSPDNEPRLHSTWFVAPVTLPERQHGPGLLILKGAEPVSAPRGVPAQIVDVSGANRGVWEVFRRYLFDWRTALSTPLALLIDKDGRAAKVYDRVPDAAQVSADLALIERGGPLPALPFAGTFHRQPHRDYYKFGAALLWAGYNEPALSYLEEVLRESPDNARVLLLMGQVHLRANRADQAEQYLKHALAVNPSYADAWSEMGGVWAARGDWAQALAYYEKALLLKPGLSYALLNAAQAAEKTGAPEKAEAYYRRALASDPESADAANGLGLLLAKQGRSDEARKLFQQAISLRRDYASAINNLGVLYLEAGQVNDAVAAFDYGIRVAPDEDILYLNLGRIYARKGQIEKAREVMQALLARKPGNETAQRALRELERRP